MIKILGHVGLWQAIHRAIDKINVGKFCVEKEGFKGSLKHIIPRGKAFVGRNELIKPVIEDPVSVECFRYMLIGLVERFLGDLGKWR